MGTRKKRPERRLFLSHLAEAVSAGKQSETFRCKLKIVVFTRVAEFFSPNTFDQVLTV